MATAGDKSVFSKYKTSNEDRVCEKIKLVFNPNATSADEILTVIKEYTFRGNEFNLFTSNLKYLEFLELCTQPKTDEEKENILSDFKNKLESVSGKRNFCEFDILCLYALYYTYESKSTCLSAVSRSLYAWFKLDDLVCRKHENRNSMLYATNDGFLTELRQFTNIMTDSEGDKILIFAWYESIMSGNHSLARFLLKFGLIEFDCHVNSIQLLSMVLNKFKENPKLAISINLEELAFRMQLSKFSFRRSVLTLYTIVIVAEYKMYELLVEESGDADYVKLKCKTISKMKCLDLLISATTEAKITLRDIKYFIATILNPCNNAEISTNDLLETFPKMSFEDNTNYNPRTLKDLARCEIRACLRSRWIPPGQLQKLSIPDHVKEFLLFYCEGMWEFLEESHQHVLFINNI